MTPILEKTCKCIKECIFNGYEFHKGREYQVDIYPLFNKVYNNGGWDEYVFFEDNEENEFNEYFKLIE